MNFKESYVRLKAEAFCAEQSVLPLPYKACSSFFSVYPRAQVFLPIPIVESRVRERCLQLINHCVSVCVMSIMETLPLIRYSAIFFSIGQNPAFPSTSWLLLKVDAWWNGVQYWL